MEQEVAITQHEGEVEGEAEPQQPSRNEVEAGMAGTVADENPSHDNASPDQQGVAEAEGRADQEEDDFGDFDAAPNNAPSAHGDLPSTEHQEDESKVDDDDDDDFGDFTSEPEPQVEAAGQQHHTVPDQHIPAPSVNTANLMDLKGEALRVAIAQSWATAFGTAKVARSHLEESELQVLRQHQQQIKTMPNGTSSNTITAHVGIPLEIRQAGAAPPLNGIGMYQSAVQCEHDTCWTHPRSEARLLQSLGLAKVAAQARSNQAVSVRATSSQDVCKDLFGTMLLQGKQAEVVRKGQSAAVGRMDTSMQAKYGEALRTAPSLTVTLTACPTLSHWQQKERQQTSSLPHNVPVQTSDLLGLSQEPTHTASAVVATPPKQRSLFANWREDQRQWEEQHGSPHPQSQPIDTTYPSEGVTPVSPARFYVPHDPTVVPVEPPPEDPGVSLLGDELPVTNAYCIETTMEAADDAQTGLQDVYGDESSEAIDIELELAVARHLDAMSQPMQAMFATDVPDTEFEHVPVSEQYELPMTAHGAQLVVESEDAMATNKPTDVYATTQPTEQSSALVEMRSASFGKLSHLECDQDKPQNTLQSDAGVEVQDLTYDSFLDTAPHQASSRVMEQGTAANCSTSNIREPSTDLSLSHQHNPALTGRSISYPPVLTSWSMGCDNGPLDSRSISHTEQTALHQAQEAGCQPLPVGMFKEAGTGGWRETSDLPVASTSCETSIHLQQVSNTAGECGSKVGCSNNRGQYPEAVLLSTQTQQPADTANITTEWSADNAEPCDEPPVTLPGLNAAPSMAAPASKSALNCEEELDLGKALHAAVLAVEDATNTAAAVVAALSVLDHITTSTTVILNSVSPPASIKAGFVEGDEAMSMKHVTAPQAGAPDAAIEQHVTSHAVEIGSTSHPQVPNSDSHPASTDSIDIAQVGASENLLSREFAIKWLTNTCFDACEPSSRASDRKACLEGKPDHVEDVCTKMAPPLSMETSRNPANTMERTCGVSDALYHDCVTLATRQAEVTETNTIAERSHSKEHLINSAFDEETNTGWVQPCHKDSTPATGQSIFEGDNVHEDVLVPLEERRLSNLQQDTTTQEAADYDDACKITSRVACPDEAAADTPAKRRATTNTAADALHCATTSIQCEPYQAVPEGAASLSVSQLYDEPYALQPPAVVLEGIPHSEAEQGSGLYTGIQRTVTCNQKDSVQADNIQTTVEMHEVHDPASGNVLDQQPIQQPLPSAAVDALDTSCDRLVTLGFEIAGDTSAIKCIVTVVGIASDSTKSSDVDGHEETSTNHITPVVVLPGVDDDVFGRLLETSVALDPAVSEDPSAVLEAQFGQTLMQALRNMSGRGKALKTQQQLAATSKKPKTSLDANRPLPDPFEGLLDYELAAQVAVRALDRAVDTTHDIDPEEAAQAHALMNALQQGLFRDLVSDLHAQSNAMPRPEGMVAAHEAEVLRKHFAWVAKCEADAAEAAVQKARQRELEAERRAAEIEEAASKAVVTSVVTAVFGSVFLSAATKWAPALSPTASPQRTASSKPTRPVPPRGSTPLTVTVADNPSMVASVDSPQNTASPRSPAAQVTGRFPPTYSPSRFYSQCSEPEITPLNDHGSEVDQRPARQHQLHSAADIVSAWASSSSSTEASQQDAACLPQHSSQQLQCLPQQGTADDLLQQVDTNSIDVSQIQGTADLLIQVSDDDEGDVDGPQAEGDDKVLHGMHSWERFEGASPDPFPSAVPLPRLTPQSSALGHGDPTGEQPAVVPGNDVADVDSEEEATVQRLTRLLSAGIASPKSIQASPSTVDAAKRRLSQTMPPLLSSSERRPVSLGGKSSSNRLAVNIMDDLSTVQVVDLQSVGLLPSPAAKPYTSVTDSPRIDSRPPSSRGWSMSPRPPLQLFDETGNATCSLATATGLHVPAPQDQLTDLRQVVDANLGHAVEADACSQMLLKSLHVPRSPSASAPAPPELWLKTFRSSAKPAGHSAPPSQSGAADSPQVGAVWHTPASSVAHEDHQQPKVIPALQELDPLGGEQPIHLNHGRPVSNMMRPSSHTRMQLDVYSQLTARRIPAAGWPMCHGGLLDQAWAEHLRHGMDNHQSLSPQRSTSTVASVSSYSSVTWSAPPTMMVGIERPLSAMDAAVIGHHTGSDSSQQQGMPAGQHHGFQPRRLF